VGDEHASEGGGDHRRRRLSGEERTQAVGESGAESGGEGRVHQHAGALQVARRVQAGRQQEMAFEEGLALLEEPQEPLARLQVGTAHRG
jgi:hypothetical protein